MNKDIKLGLRQLARFVTRLVISGLFLYSGWVKLVDLPAFASAVQGYRILPAWGIIPAAAVLPWLEIWCGMAMWITPPFRRAAWIWSTLLLLVFTLAKISVMQRGIITACGCGGGDDPMTWADVWINGIWLAFSLAGWRWDKRG